ncbi:hypothetical protein A0J61_11110 [Choanephora cucurbitarum]|uniref:Uncharacterized protein n=1 Tax=Choanephora cucurbitarum TaxID=101091 RepID=A0A1C7MVD7_9FUNG|nr:hypothetical protein A0J61_11110 [Choanephora cucurbitarum]
MVEKLGESYSLEGRAQVPIPKFNAVDDPSQVIPSTVSASERSLFCSCRGCLATVVLFSFALWSHLLK